MLMMRSLACLNSSLPGDFIQISVGENSFSLCDSKIGINETLFLFCLSTSISVALDKASLCLSLVEHRFE